MKASSAREARLDKNLYGNLMMKHLNPKTTWAPVQARVPIPGQRAQIGLVVVADSEGRGHNARQKPPAKEEVVANSFP